MSGGLPGKEAPERSAAPTGPAGQHQLSPGAIVAGRYRLLDQVGSDRRVPATLWRARDIVLERDVALTLLTGNGALDAKRTLDVAAATARFEHPGLARVLDVLDEPRAGSGLAGVVVNEWIPGASIAALSLDAEREKRQLPSGVIARALAPLAAAIDTAHRSGLALGCDHPQRIWIGNDGQARLVFPAIPPLATQVGDVRGIGAALYLLLVNSWPLPDPPAGLPAAPRTATGAVFAPRTLRPTVSLELSTLAERCLAGGSAGGVYTGAAVHQVLEQTATAEQETVLMPIVPGDGSVPGIWHSVDTADEVEPARRRKLAIAMAILVAATLLVVGWVSLQVANFLATDDSGFAPTIAVGQPSGSPSQSATQPPPQPAGPIQAAQVRVYDITGDPDNQNRVDRVIDGKPESAWKTYDYKQPFPALKPGVGVMVSFAEPVKLAAVLIDSPSAGSKVEIRSTSSGDANLDDTTVIGQATLNEGRTEIRLDQAEPSQHLLLWITQLSDRTGTNATELGELTFMRAD